MILRKTLSVIVAISAMAAAAAVCVVAAAFALYALLRDPLTPAGAAGAVALTAAVLAAIVGLVAVMLFKGPKPKRDEETLTSRLIELARARPIIAAGAAAAAGLVLLRNPGVVTTLLGVALANRKPGADRKR